MTVVSRHEPVPAELASFDALNRRQVMCRDVSIRRPMHADGKDRSNWRGLRVLVVNGQHQALVNGRVELARRLGHTVSQATDGFAALRVAVAYRPDVVLLDWGLTLFDTCQITRHLRFDFPRKDVWIIAVTGRINDERHNKCTDAGTDVLLTEPVDPDVFETLLMLECGRVNKSETDEPAALAGDESIPARSLDNVN